MMVPLRRNTQCPRQRNQLFFVQKDNTTKILSDKKLSSLSKDKSNNDDGALKKDYIVYQKKNSVFRFNQKKRTIKYNNSIICKDIGQ